MMTKAEDIKKGFGHTDGKFVVWQATDAAEPALAAGRVKIPVKFADGNHGYVFPKYGTEIEGVYVFSRGRAPNN